MNGLAGDSTAAAGTRRTRGLPGEQEMGTQAMMERILWIKDDRDVGRLYEAGLALLYKHSPKCSVCRAALHEVEDFMQQYPEAEVYGVDVLAHRDLSQQVAARTGITHESPQVIIFRDGKPLWSDSHFGITAGAIGQQFESARS